MSIATVVEVVALSSPRGVSSQAVEICGETIHSWMATMFNSETLAQVEIVSPRRRTWIFVTLAIVIAAMVIRLVANLRHPIAPGMDAAYYPLQTIWLIEHGELLIRDMPLIFRVDAAVTALLMWLQGTSRHEAAMLASRLVDGVAHPWVAVPIMLLGYGWCCGKRVGIAGSAAAAIFAVMSPPVMRMAGDFQKNSLGLVWLAFCIWAMREALAHRSSWWRWGRLIFFFALASVTHIGAFGATLVVLGGALFGYIVAASSWRVERQHLVIALAGLVGLVCLIGVMGVIEPGRTRRLLSIPLLALQGGVNMSLGSIVVAIPVYLAVGLVFRALWRQRQSYERSDVGIVIGALIGLLVLFVPMSGGPWSMRLQLMSPLLVSIVAAFFFAQTNSWWGVAWARRVILVGVGALALVAPLAMQGPVISVAATSELRELGNDLANPETTLVVAPHGLQLWAGYLMGTHIQMSRIPEDLTPYERVLLLEPNGDVRGQRRRPPGRGENRAPRRERRRGGGPDHELVLPEGAVPIRKTDQFTLYEYRRQGEQ